MLDTLVAVAQFLSATALVYGLLVTYANRDCADPRRYSQRARTAKASTPHLRTHRGASRAAISR